MKTVVKRTSSRVNNAAQVLSGHRDIPKTTQQFELCCLAYRNMNTSYRGVARPKGRIMVSAAGRLLSMRRSRLVDGQCYHNEGEKNMQITHRRNLAFHSTRGALNKGIHSMRQQIFALPYRLCCRLLCMLLESSMRKSAFGAPQNIRKLIRTGCLLGHFRAYFL